MVQLNFDYIESISYESTVSWNREIRKVHRPVLNYTAYCEFVELMKGKWREWKWSVGYVGYFSWWTQVIFRNSIN